MIQEVWILRFWRRRWADIAQWMGVGCSTRSLVPGVTLQTLSGLIIEGYGSGIRVSLLRILAGLIFTFVPMITTTNITTLPKSIRHGRVITVPPSLICLSAQQNSIRVCLIR